MAMLASFANGPRGPFVERPLMVIIKEEAVLINYTNAALVQLVPSIALCHAGRWKV